MNNEQRIKEIKRAARAAFKAWKGENIAHDGREYWKGRYGGLTYALSILTSPDYSLEFSEKLEEVKA